MDLEQEIRHLIRHALDEDLGHGDITSMACLPETATASGIFMLKESGVIAGLPTLPILFGLIDPELEISYLAQEGSFQKVGSHIAKVTGSLRSILAGERVALNLLQHASGVATITSEYVKRTAGLKCDILDTRKTIPGLRSLEKYAVAVGGGKNHRSNLSDCFLIKSSHLAYLTPGERHPITEAIEKIKEFRTSPHANMPIEIQIDTLSHLEEALKHDFRAILLRNMSIDELELAIAMIHKTNKKAYIAYSGGVNLETVRSIAETGVSGISVSSITHSVPGIDIGLRLK
jgi:nicotinate-nucleotide pyrophosphorylase (carboxylating)